MIAIRTLLQPYLVISLNEISSILFILISDIISLSVRIKSSFSLSEFEKGLLADGWPG